MEINRAYPCHPANYRRGRALPVLYLVIHYVGAEGGAQANAEYYHRARVLASANYFVGHASEGAAVFGSVDEADTAYHCGRCDGKYKHPACRNANSIGIEMCCHIAADGTWYFDPETVDATVELAQDIMARYGIPIDHVLRHYDVTGKLCPRPYMDEDAWAAFKARLVAAGREDKVMVYTTTDEVPKWAQPLVKKAQEAGLITGDGNGKLNLTDETLRTLAIMDKAGIVKG